MSTKALKRQKNRSTTPFTQSHGGIQWAYPLGFWSAIFTTLLGIIYFLAIAGAILTGNFIMPPPDALQLMGGIVSLLSCPALLVLMASLHTVTPAEKKAFSLSALTFTVLFAAVVSINRYTQLGVVQQSLASGNIEGIGWFLPYGERSVMLGLELMGWGWFLGLAMISAAPLFSGGKLELWLRWLMVLYGVLGLISAVAFLVASPLTAAGFIAWGLVLFIITGLLAAYFRQGGR